MFAAVPSDSDLPLVPPCGRGKGSKLFQGEGKGSGSAVKLRPTSKFSHNPRKDRVSEPGRGKGSQRKDIYAKVAQLTAIIDANKDCFDSEMEKLVEVWRQQRRDLQAQLS